MSENVQITPGSGVTIGADSVTDITLGSAQIQYIKIMDGSIGGTNKAGVTSNGLAVDGSGVTQPISAISLPLPTGAATDTNQATEISYLTTIATNTTNSGTPTVSGTVTVLQPTATNLNATVNQLNAADLLTTSYLNDGSGNAISSTSGALDVFVSNFPATQPVSGTVAVTQSTSPWVISGTITTSPDVNVHDGSGNAISSIGGSLSVGVTNFPATQAVTQSTSPWVVSLASTTITGTVAVTQSGTWSTGRTWTLSQSTDSIDSWLFDGTGNAITSTTGSLNVNVTNASGLDTVNQGNPNTLANAWPVIPTDGTNSQVFTAAGEAQVIITEPLPAGTNVIGAVTQSGTWNLNNISGTISLPTGASTEATLASLNSKVTVVNTGAVTISAALPAGANVIGHVITDSGSTTAVTGNVSVVQSTASNLNATVTGTVVATQATGSNLHTVIDSGSITVANATLAVTQSGTWNIGTLTSITNPVAVTGTFWQATQPISATSLPLPTGAATSANQTNASQKTQIVDGSGNVIASTSNSLNVNVTNTEPISGTVTSNQGTPNTLANGWPVELTDGTNILGTSSHPVRIDPTGTTTQPISGTITTNQGTSPWVVSLTSTTITGTTTVAGNLTHNNAAPIANNIGVLPAIASSSVPTYTTGDQVLLSTDLSGNLRVTIDSTASEQNVNLNQVGGSTISIGQATMAASLPVVLASNQSAIPVTLTSTTITGTVAVTQSTSPWVISGTVTTTPPANASTNVTQWDGVALGSPSAYGTSPGAINVIGVNAFITNTPTVTANAGTGTFAISAASLPLPTGASTSAKQPALGTAGTASNDVITVQGIASMTALKVDGSAVTQPISGTVTSNIGTTNGLALDATLTGGSQKAQLSAWIGSTAPTIGSKTSANSIPVVVASDQSSIPVTQSGTWTATVTQPTASNLNATVAQGAAASATDKWPVCITDSGGVNQATVNGSGQLEVVAPTITKGTQGSTGFTTQDLKDAGRTYVTFTADAVAGVTSETLVTFTLNKQGTTTATQTNYTPTNGKTLRIQSITLSVQSGAGAGGWVRVKLRHNTAGATTTSSALVTIAETGTSNATALGAGLSVPIPDGLEFYGNGTQTIGITHISSATTTVESITVCGYEY